MLLSLQYARLSELPSSFVSHFSRTPQQCSVTDIRGLRSKVSKVEGNLDFPVLANLASEFARKDIFALLSRDNMALSEPDWIVHRDFAIKLDSSIHALSAVAREYAIDSDALFCVRLGQATQIGIVADALRRLDLILNQGLSILPEPETAQAKSWETGSLWINMLAGSVAGVVLIGGIAWSAACAFKKYQEGCVVQRLVGSMDKKNEALDALVSGIEGAVSIIITEEATRLDQNHSAKKGDAETISRLRNCIKELFELMKGGVEIHPSLMAPEAVKNVFPNFSDLLGHPTSQGLLKEHSEQSSSESSSPV